MRNSALLYRTPRDWISTKEDKKSTCGGTIIGVTNPVCIRKTMQCLRSVYKKPYTKGSRAIKIMKQTFDRSPMALDDVCINWESLFTTKEIFSRVI